MAEEQTTTTTEQTAEPTPVAQETATQATTEVAQTTQTSAETATAAATAEEPKEEKLYTLVDTTEVEKTSFLKRGTIKQITLWNKLFALQGKVSRRLDLITDLKSLQFLYWNTTKQAPAEDAAEVSQKVDELAAQLPVDQSTPEELSAQLASLAPAEQTVTHDEAVQNGGVPRVKKLALSAADKAALKAQKDAAKEAEKLKKKQAKEAAKAEKLALKAAEKANKPAKAPKEPKVKAEKAPKAPKTPKVKKEKTVQADGERAAVRAKFAEVAAGKFPQSFIQQKAQDLYKAQVAAAAVLGNKAGKLPHEVYRQFTVVLPLAKAEGESLVDTTVGVKWLAAASVGVGVNEFATSDAVRYLTKAGFQVLVDGKPMEAKQKAAVTEKVEEVTAENAATAVQTDQPAQTAEASTQTEAAPEAPATETSVSA